MAARSSSLPRYLRRIVVKFETNMHRMTHRRVGLCPRLVVVMFFMALAGQAQPRCPFVTRAEAISILGGNPAETFEAGYSCSFTLPGETALLAVQVVRIGSFAPQSFQDSRREFVSKKMTVKDEPGLGSPAFSILYSEKGEGVVGIFALKNPTTVVQVIITEKRPTVVLTRELDKLRGLVKQLLGKI